MGSGKPPTTLSAQKDVQMSIRGMYFKNTITTTVFIPFTGSMGSFVINNVSPVDPKAQKIEGAIFPRQPTGPKDYGPDKYDAQFKPDATRANNIDQSTITGKQIGVFFPFGTSATGNFQLI